MSRLGQQLRECREQRNISQRALSDATGIEQATISRIERGEMSLVSPHLEKLARELRIEILNPLGSNVGPITLEGSLVPVWPQLQTARIALLPHAEQERETMQHIMSTNKHSALTFAMRIQDDSMLPRFRAGDTVVVDPTRQPAVGKFVVAARMGEPGAILAQYASRGVDAEGANVFELTPLNPLYPSNRSDREVVKILGVVVEKRETDL